MYFCTVDVNSRVMICTLSSTHWQQASTLRPFELIWKDWHALCIHWNGDNSFPLTYDIYWLNHLQFGSLNCEVTILLTMTAILYHYYCISVQAMAIYFWMQLISTVNVNGSLQNNKSMQSLMHKDAWLKTTLKASSSKLIPFKFIII